MRANVPIRPGSTRSLLRVTAHNHVRSPGWLAEIKEILMKYSKLLVAGVAALALAGCFTLPAGPAGPQGATGNTGATGYTGATGEPVQLAKPS